MAPGIRPHLADLETDAVDQLKNACRLPVSVAGALMPDAHLGKGATVGSVIPTLGAIIPAAVGVDIGCGMSAVRTNLTDADLPDDLGALRSAIEATIPVGFHAHDAPVNPHRIHGLPTAGWDTFWAGFGDLHAGVGALEGDRVIDLNRVNAQIPERLDAFIEGSTRPGHLQD